MRIGVVYLGRRGAGGPISYELATNLAHHAEVFAVVSEYAEGLDVWKGAGIELLIVPTYRGILGFLLSLVTQLKIRGLARQIRTRKPDVLIFPMFFTWNPFLQYCLKDIPGVVAVHDPEPHPDLVDRFYWLLENHSIRQAAQCVLFSKRLAVGLERRGVEKERMNHIPLGELSYYQHLTKPSDVPIRPDVPIRQIPTLLFFGRITAYKGLDILFRAFDEIRQRYPVKLHIVGAGDLRQMYPSAPYLRDPQDLSQVEIDNRWVAEHEIGEFFSQASIVVLPYTSASQSGVVPIAASFGLPVIATRVGGIPEQIEHGRTGILIDPGSPEQLVEAISRLLDDPTLARTLGGNLQTEYQQHRNWAKIAEMFLAVCGKAVSVGHA